MLRLFLRGLRIACAGLALACAASSVALAETAAAPTVSVLTFGPGTHPFFKFGHNAIWIQPPGGRGTVYNFGTFAFDTPNLIPKFLQGRFQYWLSRSPIDDTLWSYESSDRTIIVQELDLSPAEATLLAERLDVNARPENRAYLYDYFWDNCSTRVRDAIDAALGGRLRQLTVGKPGQQTFRAHGLRLVHDVWWEYLGIDFGLGNPVDRPLDVWLEGFVPEMLRRTLRAATVVREGVEKPLVRHERVLYTSTRPDPPETQPVRSPYFLLTGVALGAGLAGLGRLAVRRRIFRVLFGGVLLLVGLVGGFLGLALPLVWIATNHRAAYANENMLQCSPHLVAFIVLGAAVTFGVRRLYRATFFAAAAAVALSGLGLLLKPLPGFDQANYGFILFFLPFWLGLAFATRGLALADPTRTARTAR